VSLALEYANGVCAVFKRDCLIFASYRFRVVSQSFSMLFSLITFYFVSHLVHVSAFGSPSVYFAFVVFGIVIMSVLMSATTLPDLFRSELVAGTFERTLVSPMGPVAGLLAMVAFPIVYSAAFSAVMLAVATGAFGLPVRMSGIPLAIPVAGLGALAFGSIGLMLVAAVLVFKQTPGHAYLGAAIGLFGGAYFPVALLPQWLQWVSYVQPFTPALDLLRHLLLGTASLERPWVELLSLSAWVLILVPTAASVVGAAVRVGRNRGVILEY
jgi:ABC-2 type transport system permease protein